MNKKLMLSLCAAGAITVSGCTTVADMAGADTATLNATASKSYNEMVQDARNKNQLDTSSTTYKRINTVFQRLIPYANQMNQTGQPFQWQLAVLKSDTATSNHNIFISEMFRIFHKIFYSFFFVVCNIVNQRFSRLESS